MDLSLLERCPKHADCGGWLVNGKCAECLDKLYMERGVHLNRARAEVRRLKGEDRKCRCPRKP